MSTMLVTSGFTTVTAAVVAGISPLMEQSAALQELLTVWFYMQTGTNHNLLRHRHIEGHCNNIQKGKVRVGFWVGKCVTGQKLADAATGWHSMNRIFIEEVPKAQQ